MLGVSEVRVVWSPSNKVRVKTCAKGCVHVLEQRLSEVQCGARAVHP